MKKYTYDEIKAMNNEERAALRNELTTMMDSSLGVEDWDFYYSIYETLNNVVDDEYYKYSIADFNWWVAEHITGKSFVDDNDWQYYSDWHKDLFGWRPKNRPGFYAY